eukprot:SAG11_NODE_19717_length_460_cov_0.997230_1_plen_48_part_10
MVPGRYFRSKFTVELNLVSLKFSIVHGYLLGTRGTVLNLATAAGRSES